MSVALVLLGATIWEVATARILLASESPQRLVILRPLTHTAHGGLVSAVHARLTSSLRSRNGVELVDQQRVDNLWQRKWNRSVALEDVVALGRELLAEQVLVSLVNRTPNGYQIQFTAIRVEQEGIVFEEEIEARDERELLDKVTVAAERVYSRRNELFSYPHQFLFLSLFVPGKAQWSHGSRLKGAMFFTGVVGLFAASALIPKGDRYFGAGELSIRSGETATDFHYFIGSNEVERGEFLAEARRRERARQSRQQASRRKRLLRYTGLAIHAVNIIDAFLLGRRYEKDRLRTWTVRLQALPPLGTDPDDLRVGLTLRAAF